MFSVHAINVTSPFLSESKAFRQFLDMTSLPPHITGGSPENAQGDHPSRSAAVHGLAAQTGTFPVYRAQLPSQLRPPRDREERSSSLSAPCERSGKCCAKCGTSTREN